MTTESLQLAGYDIKPGVTSDEGDGDDWPEIRRQILDADILAMGTAIRMGQPSSICKRALKRMDAFLEEKDDKGRMSPSVVWPSSLSSATRTARTMSQRSFSKR